MLDASTMLFGVPGDADSLLSSGDSGGAFGHAFPANLRDNWLPTGPVRMRSRQPPERGQRHAQKERNSLPMSKILKRAGVTLAEMVRRAGVAIPPLSIVPQAYCQFVPSRAISEAA